MRDKRYVIPEPGGYQREAGAVFGAGILRSCAACEMLPCTCFWECCKVQRWEAFYVTLEGGMLQRAEAPHADDCEHADASRRSG